MIVELKILYDDMDNSKRRASEQVIRAVDKAMRGADWEANGEGWIARC